MTMPEVYRFSLRRLMGTTGEYLLHERWATIPNAVTTTGIIGVMFYTWLFLTNSAAWTIPLVHLGILATDWLDGILADKLNQHSRLGKFLDPLRDRMHAAALFGNFIFVSTESAIVIALTVAVAAEVWIGLLALRGYVRNAHTIGKLRAVVYGICGLMALIQLYWVGEEIVPLSVLAITMAAASIGASFFYTRSAQRP